jgi:glycosyltransferase involved in cell wall biosynthesis
MIQELFPEFVQNSQTQIQEKKQAISAAQGILCVSQNTKNDLLKIYNIPEEKIFVIPLASELHIDQSNGDHSVPAKPYFLYVGSRYTYKNFDKLLLAFGKIGSLCAETQLCVVGQPFTPNEVTRITELGLSRVVLNFGSVSDEHLAKLYRCSVAFVYPSLYEGFGIPPLEAMACHTPVIASNVSSLPEVIGDAGLLVDPHSILDLADAMLLLLTSSFERERLIAKGQARVKQFSWAGTVAQTINVYHSLAS